MGPDVQVRSLIPRPVRLPLCPFPTLCWWQDARHPDARLDAHEHYQKRSFRNRIHLMTANGLQRLTVPVERRGGEPRPQDQTMRSDGEGMKMWRAVHTAYGAAPFFDELSPELESLFMMESVSLGEWNRATMRWSAEWLGVTVPADAELPSAPPVPHDQKMARRSEFWMDSPGMASGWPHIWRDRGKDIPFGRLSCLDVILHCGPEAGRWVSPAPSSGSLRRG